MSTVLTLMAQYRYVLMHAKSEMLDRCRWQGYDDIATMVKEAFDVVSNLWKGSGWTQFSCPELMTDSSRSDPKQSLHRGGKMP